MDQQVKECRSALFVTPKFLERRSALPLKICWSYGAALLVLERLPKSGEGGHIAFTVAALDTTAVQGTGTPS